MDKKLINEPQHIKDLTDIELCEKAGLPWYYRVINSALSKRCFEIAHKHKIAIDYFDELTVCSPFPATDDKNDDAYLLSVSDINPCRAVLMAVVWKNEVVK